MTQIERRQARIRRIRNHLDNSNAIESEGPGSMCDTETLMHDLDVRYHIGKSQNNPEHIILFLQNNQRDPAIKASLVSMHIMS